MKRKRLTALALSVCLCIGTVAGGMTASYAAETQTTQLQIIRAMGILTGDQNGNLSLGSNVTRAQFVKMMSVASKYKDSIGNGSGVSLFKDVKNSYWASEYIKLGIEQGWVYGYVDGTFKPGKNITLEEACTALLRLLGYDSSSLTGSYPSAQLSKAYSLGLRNDLSASQGTVLTRQDCVTLFYNLMLCENSEGQVYGSTLGYTITNDQIDYSSLVSENTEGPYVYDGSASNLTFANSNTSVFRNGSESTLSALTTNDVYYYSSNMNTVWIYDDKVSGTLTQVSPNTASPKSVAVSGVSYDLGTSTAEYKCSSLGSFKEGDLVTLLLGKDGDVVDIVSPSSTSSTVYGIVISSENVSTTSNNSATVQKKTVIACADGTERSFYHTGSSVGVGKVVSVKVTASDTVISNAQNSMSGTVSADGSSFGGVKFAQGAGIIDTDEYGNYARIYASRLAGCTLSSSNVLYYEKNSAGEISSLILRDATGDFNTYGYITSLDTNDAGMNVSAVYTYFSNGQRNSLNSDTIYSAGVGGAAFIYKEGQIKSIQQLKSVNISSMESNSLTARSGSTNYDIWENAQVLIKDSSNNVYSTDLSSVNTSDYTLTGWYDNLGYQAGQSIRIIVAVAK